MGSRKNSSGPSWEQGSLAAPPNQQGTDGCHLPTWISLSPTLLPDCEDTEKSPNSDRAGLSFAQPLKRRGSQPGVTFLGGHGCQPPLIWSATPDVTLPTAFPSQQPGDLAKTCVVLLLHLKPLGSSYFTQGQSQGPCEVSRALCPPGLALLQPHWLLVCSPKPQCILAWDPLFFLCPEGCPFLPTVPLLPQIFPWCTLFSVASCHPF